MSKDQKPCPDTQSDSVKKQIQEILTKGYGYYPVNGFTDSRNSKTVDRLLTLFNQLKTEARDKAWRQGWEEGLHVVDQRDLREARLDELNRVTKEFYKEAKAGDTNDLVDYLNRRGLDLESPEVSE